jgi:hypothetical protein
VLKVLLVLTSTYYCFNFNCELSLCIHKMDSQLILRRYGIGIGGCTTSLDCRRTVERGIHLVFVFRKKDASHHVSLIHRQANKLKNTFIVRMHLFYVNVSPVGTHFERNVIKCHYHPSIYSVRIIIINSSSSC